MWRAAACTWAENGLPLYAKEALQAYSQGHSCLSLTRNAGTNDGKGSNNWVLAGTRTVSGKPLLANDPHLGLSAPAIWYFAGMQSPAGKASKGWVATANQRITAPGYAHYLTQDWALPYRYERIAQLIEATEKHDAQSMQAIHSVRPGGSGAIPFHLPDWPERPGVFPHYRDMNTVWAQTGYRVLQRQPARWAHELTLAPATP